MSKCTVCQAPIPDTNEIQPLCPACLITREKARLLEYKLPTAIYHGPVYNGPVTINNYLEDESVITRIVEEYLGERA